MKRSNEPFVWALFSGGGMLSALLLPAVALVLWVAVPVGWVAMPSYDDLHSFLGRPLVRLILWGVIALSAFHWGHRFRFTLYDGLQLSHLWGLIASVCYGGATILTIAAAYVLLTFS